jgi:hypothetical protein
MFKIFPSLLDHLLGVVKKRLNNGYKFIMIVKESEKKNIRKKTIAYMLKFFRSLLHHWYGKKDIK